MTKNKKKEKNQSTNQRQKITNYQTKNQKHKQEQYKTYTVQNYYPENPIQMKIVQTQLP